MERRVLLAISLSFLVLFGYQTLFPPPDPANQAQPTTGSQSGAAGVAPAPVAAASAPSVAPAAAGTAAQPAGAVRADTAEREFVVETATIRAVFTNRGARLKRWVLKDYRDAAGVPVDLVPTDVPNQPLPFTLGLDSQGDTDQVNNALFLAENDPPPTVDATTTPAALTFVYEGADGLTVRKQFMLQPTGYEFAATFEVKRGGSALNPRIQWGPGLGDEIARAAGSGGLFSGSYSYPAAAFLHRDGKIERWAGSKAGSAGVQQGVFRYAGVTDHYFVASTIEQTAGQRVEFAHIPVTSGGETPTTRQFVAFTLAFDRAPGEIRFFAGPKQFEALKAVDPEFTKVIDFGMFSILAVPLLGALQWVHGFVGNYGWSIVVLTLLINLAMAPLRHKSVVSMRKMQEIQPRLKAIQDRYAHLKMTDPARGKMNEEVMALYKQSGANPASGCVPMLLTLPVLFAFYALLSQAIEIRGAHFAGWITDLSQKDPWYITPLLMGATMFWQQRLQPGTGDPVQQKVLMFMPVMFTAMFMQAPSGLVIYWFVSNLWAIGQQYFTNWMIGPAKAVAGGKR
ncbi:MAG: membrane protein insertase YidC [Vicinamibacterales bacterium]